MILMENIIFFFIDVFKKRLKKFQNLIILLKNFNQTSHLLVSGHNEKYLIYVMIIILLIFNIQLILFIII